MRRSKKIVGLRSLALASALAISGLAPNMPATADTSWISDPSLEYVTFAGSGNTKNGNLQTLSSQSDYFVLKFESSASNAGKFAQVNFFDLSAGLIFSPTSSPLASPSGCELQVLSGNRNSCMFKLDNSGAASVTINVAGASKTATFKYLLLTGPNINQSQVGQARFVLPAGKVTAVAKSAKAFAGGAALVRFKIADGKKAKAGMKVKIKVRGIRSNISTRTATSDANGMVWVYIANTESKLGMTYVSATIQGGKSTAEASIWWVEEPKS